MPIFAPKSPQYRASVAPARFAARGPDLRPAVAVGRGISAIGNVLQIAGERLKKERDAAVVGDLYSRWREADRTEVSELLSQQGKNAINLGARYDASFSDSQSSIDGETENGAQQAMLNDLLDRKREQNLDILARYQAQEGKRYKQQVEDGMVVNAEADMREHGFNDEKVDETLGSLFDWIDTAYPGQDMTALKQKYKSQLLFANMQTRIDQEPDAALESLEEPRMKADLGSGYHRLKQIALAKKKSLAVEARVAKNAAETKAKEAEKAAFDAEELEISTALYVDKDPVRAAILFGKSAFVSKDATSIAKWVPRFEKAAKGEKTDDPFTISDTKPGGYLDTKLDEATAGLIDPGTVRPIANQLSRTDASLLRRLAEYAVAPDKKYIMDLSKAVQNEGKDIIVGTDWMFIEKPEKAIKDASALRTFILTEMVNAETDAEKIDLLNRDSKNFVLRKAFQHIGRDYDKDKEQLPGYSSMFFESGGQKKQEEITDVRQLWGEKVPKRPKKPVSFEELGVDFGEED